MRVVDTEPMRFRPTRWMATALLASSVAGCAYLTRETDPNSCAEPSARPTRVAGPDVPTAPLNASNVVLEVNSTLADNVRLTVQFDQSLALDIQVPGTDARCATQPVYRYGYLLPQGSVKVTVTAGSSTDRTATLRVEEQRRWLVVVIQRGFPVSVREWSEKPGWG
jgi:hypothetical protein